MRASRKVHRAIGVLLNDYSCEHDQRINWLRNNDDGDPKKPALAAELVAAWNLVAEWYNDALPALTAAMPEDATSDDGTAARDDHNAGYVFEDHPRDAALTEEDQRCERIWDERLKLYDAFVRCETEYDDAAKGLEEVTDEYEASDETMRGVINYVMTALCGYTIPTLLKITDGGDPDEVVHTQRPPVVAPSTVIVGGSAASVDETAA